MSGNIPIRKGKQLDGMRAAGLCAAGILRETAAAVRPGMTTQQIDDLAGLLIAQRGVSSAFLGYRGYPGNLCISLNEEVVHGIRGPRVIQPGDIVKLDVGVVKDGWIGDNAMTVPVPPVSDLVHRLLWATEEALHVGLSHATDGTMLGDLCHSIEECVTGFGFRVVREFVGHGVGRKLHEEPQVPNFVGPRKGPKIQPGLVIAIEPMVNIGTCDVVMLEDGWTIVTRDRLPSAHFEHTIAVTENGPRILTNGD